MKSIGLRFTATMLCVVFIGISATVGASMFITGNAIIDETLEKVGYETKSEAADMNAWLSAQKAIISTLADTVSELDDFTEDQQARIFAALLADNPDCFEVYMGYPNGEGTTGTGYMFDYSWWHSYERGWYKLAMSDPAKTHITSPYTDANTGELCITVCRAVYRDGELLGVVSADIFLTTLSGMTMNATLDSKGYAMLLDEGGDVLVHPDESFAPEGEVFKNLATAAEGAYAGLWKAISGKDGIHEYIDASGVAKHYTTVTLEASGWRFVTVFPDDIMYRPIRTAVITVVVITLVILVLTSCFIFLITKREITAPIRGLASAAGRLAAGNVNISVQKKRDDEIGSLADAFTAMVESIRQQALHIESLAGGDLTVEVRPRSAEDTVGNSLVKLCGSLNAMMAGIQSKHSEGHQGHRRYCIPDQYPGPQRRCGGRPGGTARQGLCRCGGGSAEFGGQECRSRQGHRRTD